MDRTSRDTRTRQPHAPRAPRDCAASRQPGVGLSVPVAGPLGEMACSTPTSAPGRATEMRGCGVRSLRLYLPARTDGALGRMWCPRNRSSFSLSRPRAPPLPFSPLHPSSSFASGSDRAGGVEMPSRRLLRALLLAAVPAGAAPHFLPAGCGDRSASHYWRGREKRPAVAPRRRTTA